MSMFLELNIIGDTKATSYGIIVAKALLAYTITKETTKMGIKSNICPFMKRKRDETTTTKNHKRIVVKGLTMK